MNSGATLRKTRRNCWLKYIVDECGDADIPVEQVTADPIVVQELSGTKTESGVVYAGVTVTADTAFAGRFSIYRARFRSNLD